MFKISRYGYVLPVARVVLIALSIFFAFGLQTTSAQGFLKSRIDKSNTINATKSGQNNVLTKAETPLFASGNLVVCRVGAGDSTLTSVATAVFLDEYTPAGVLVSSLPLPTTVIGNNYPLTLSGTATNECMITRSTDTKYIVVPGYAALLGTPAVSSASGARVVARVDASGNIDTSSLTTSFGTSSIRGAVTRDGSAFWTVGSSAGVVYFPLGSADAGTIVSSTLTNNRAINVFNDQLYVSDAAGSSFRLSSVGAGVPSTTGNLFTNLPGFPTSGGGPNQFFFADLSIVVPGVDTLYVADDTAAPGGGLKKYSLVSGSWTLNGTFPATVTPSIPASSYYGLTGMVSGTIVTLYATRPGAAANQIVSVVDATGYNAAPISPVTLVATAAANTTFRGIALSPLLAPSAAGVMLAGRVLTADGRGIAKATVTLEGGGLDAPRAAVTGPFGYYAFEGVPAGLTYILTVGSKRYAFADPTRVVNLDDELLDADFTAEPGQ